MNLFNKETLIDAASLGAGVVAGRAATRVVISQVGPKVAVAANPLIANLAPVVAGIGMLLLNKGNNRIVNGVANGMIASSAAYYVDYAISKIGIGAGPYITGPAPVLMSGVDDVFIAGDEDFGDYSSAAYDTTSANAGEMNF